jgi:superfamily II DNA/RNA helicase
MKTAALHGDKSQDERLKSLDAFKRGEVELLVATDVAARGLDIADLPAVFNFDVPFNAEDYVHRIGRTGRAGESGLAISFVTADSEAHFQLIEKRQGAQVPREQIKGFEPVQIVPMATLAANDMTGATSNGGIKGKRPSKKDKLRAAAQEKP